MAQILASSARSVIHFERRQNCRPHNPVTVYPDESRASDSRFDRHDKVDAAAFQDSSPVTKDRILPVRDGKGAARTIQREVKNRDSIFRDCLAAKECLSPWPSQGSSRESAVTSNGQRCLSPPTGENLCPLFCLGRGI